MNTVSVSPASIEKNYFFELRQSTQEPVVLSQYLQLHENLNLKKGFTFVIPAGEKIIVADDLIYLGVISLQFLVQENASLTYVLRDTESNKDSLMLERDVSCVLVGQGAHAEIKGSCFGNAEKIFKIKTLQDHQAPNATSNVVIKTVLSDKAKFSCHSMIKVAPGAHGTHAEQVNKNILLSRHARAVSVPMLEVLANDVTCKHGAAVSKINDEEMFYLQSRGIDFEETKKLLLEAFLA